MLTKQYHIPYEMFRNAFISFQKKYVYPRSYLLMAVFLLVAGIYAYFTAIGTEQQRPMYCMIIMVCVIMCGLQWYNPRKIRRNLMESIRGLEGDLYEFRLYPEYLEIGTILPEEEVSEDMQETDALFEDVPQENFSGTRMYYSKALEVTEYPEFFIVYIKKANFYVLPKNAFSEEELNLLRGEFSRNLNDGFQSKIKSTEVK